MWLKGETRNHNLCSFCAFHSTRQAIWALPWNVHSAHFYTSQPAPTMLGPSLLSRALCVVPEWGHWLKHTYSRAVSELESFLIWDRYARMGAGPEAQHGQYDFLWPGHVPCAADLDFARGGPETLLDPWRDSPQQIRSQDPRGSEWKCLISSVG